VGPPQISSSRVGVAERRGKSSRYKIASRIFGLVIPEGGMYALKKKNCRHHYPSGYTVVLDGVGESITVGVKTRRTIRALFSGMGAFNGPSETF